MTRTSGKLLPFLLLTIGLAGCGSCGSRDAEPPKATAAAFLPARPKSVVLVPDAAKLGRTAKGLEQTRLAGLAASALGARDAAGLVAPVVRQLGFDPRTEEGFANAGLDGSRGLAFGEDGAGGQILVLAVSDAGRFDGYAAGLARRFGGETKSEAIYEGAEAAPSTGAAASAPTKVRVVTFAGADGKVRLAYGLRDGFAVIGSGAGAVESVGLSLSRPRSESLEANPAFAKARVKLAARDLYAWLPDGMGKGRARRFENGVAMGVTLGEKGVNARFLLPQGPLQVAAIHAMGKPAGMEVANLLSADDFLAVRLGGEPAAFLPAIEAIAPRRLLSAMRKAGLDPAELLSQLQPGAALGFELNPDVDLSGGLPTDPSIARTNPFGFVRLALFARVKDPAKAAAILDTLAVKGGDFGMSVAVEESGGAKVYRATYAAGEGMTWGLVGDTLVATGGEGAFAPAKARLAALQGGAKSAGGAVAAAGTLAIPGGKDAGIPGAAESGRSGPKAAPGSERATGAEMAKDVGGAKADGTIAANDGVFQPFTVKDPGARKIFETAGSAAHLDVQRLTAALRAIPSSAYGIGGFRLKELMETWVGLLAEVKGVTTSLSIDEEGVIVDADLGLE